MRPRSLLFGDSGLPVACAEVLLARGHEVAGVWTGDRRLAAWSAERAIPVWFAGPDVPVTAAAARSLVGEAGCDHLWSIHNVRLLPMEVVGLARVLAANYHDALLPKYAGLHATTWARFQGERVHGITWHRLASGLDTGEILVQRNLAVDESDTAWTLGSRAAEAAVVSFGELLGALEAGTLRGNVQEAGARTYFSGGRQPTAGCLVPWHEPAERLVDLVRALDFGPADNPIGLPKLLAPDGLLAATRIEVLARRSGAEPGTLVEIEDAAIVVATASEDVRLSGLARLSGAGMRDPWVASQAGELRPGMRFAGELEDPRAAAKLFAGMRRHESHWQEHLLDLAPLVPPSFAGEAAGHGEARFDVPFPDAPDGGDRVMRSLAAVLEALAEEIGEPFDAALGLPSWRRRVAAARAAPFVVDRLPFRVELDRAQALDERSEILGAKVEELAARGGFTADLPLRLRALRDRGRIPAPAIAIDLVDPGDDESGAGREGPEALVITLAAGRSVRFVATNGEAEALARLAARAIRATEGRTGGRPAPVAGLPAVESPRPLVERFRQWAETHPRSCAIEVEGVRVTYAELARRVTRLAAALRRRGVGAERVVSLETDHLPDLACGMLAAIAAGGAFVVLDPNDSAPRRARRLELANPHVRLVASEPGELAGVRSWGRAFREPFALADATEGPPVDSVRVTPSTLAYLAFTSGSSGAPKPVAIERRSIDHYLEVAGEQFGFGPGDRILQLGSPAFDLAYEQILGALVCGATVVGRRREAAVAGRGLIESAQTLALTVLDLPTAVWELTARDLESGEISLPRSVRCVILGGDRASLEASRAWRRAGGDGIRLINTYGPTEATIVASWWEIPGAAALAARATIPVGTAIPGVDACILDDRLEIVPEGGIGELYLGGAGLARGYHRQPAATRERFVRREEGGPRLYRTGDRARCDACGELEILGRVDRELKISGKRVAPEEIEALLGDEGVEAAVTAGEDGRLVAWIVGSDGGRGGGLDLDGLARRVAPSLPAPIARWRRLDALPRLASGKVDFGALREAAADTQMRARSEGLSPLPEELRRLGAIWASVLGVAIEKPGDDFFACGGDSLAAIALLAALERELGVVLPVEALLRAPTLEAFAGEIALRSAPLPGVSRQHAGRCRSSVVPLQPRGNRPPLFCVHGLGGHLLRLVGLARELADQPFYGLQSPGLDDGDDVPRSIEALAERFLGDVLHELSPGDPLRLCGMSFGGLVAVEMARQAEALGRPPAFVALLDTELAGVLPGFAPGPRLLAQRGRQRLRRFFGDRLGRLRRRLRRLRSGRDAVDRPNEYRHFSRVLAANEAALDAYVLGPLRSALTFFAATPRDPALYAEFERRTGAPLEIVPVPGDHLSMLEAPQVATLARELRQRLGPPA